MLVVCVDRDAIVVGVESWCFASTDESILVSMAMSSELLWI